VRELVSTGLLRVSPQSSPTEYELTDLGRGVFELVSGLVPSSRGRLGWLVTASVESGDAERIRLTFDDVAESATFRCSGDADYIALLPEEAHDLALALSARLKAQSVKSSRTLVLTRL
jgi:hypothetical protein